MRKIWGIIYTRCKKILKYVQTKEFCQNEKECKVGMNILHVDNNQITYANMLWTKKILNPCRFCKVLSYFSIKIVRFYFDSSLEIFKIRHSHVSTIYICKVNFTWKQMGAFLHTKSCERMRAIDHALHAPQISR